jgi:hypothetical protein
MSCADAVVTNTTVASDPSAVPPSIGAGNHASVDTTFMSATKRSAVDDVSSPQDKRRRVHEETDSPRSSPLKTASHKAVTLAPDSQDEDDEGEPAGDDSRTDNNLTRATAASANGSDKSASNLAAASAKPSAREAWTGADGTPVIEMANLVVRNTQNKKENSNSAAGKKKNFKAFQKGKRGGGVASIARRQVIDVVEAEGEWTDEALKEMDIEHEKYREAEVAAAAEEDFVPRVKVASKAFDRSKRKRR